MVTTEQQGFVKLIASLVELKIACSIIELLVLDRVGLGDANISEDVRVKVHGTVMNTLTLLSLTALAQDGAELAQFLELVLHVCHFPESSHSLI